MYQRQSKSLPNHWSSVLWADASGYYGYLPFVLIYHCNASSIPMDAADSVGNGFSIDKETTRFRNKYTYGVAFLQLPFFLIVHSFQSFSEAKDNSGFSPAYYWVIYLAALFYGLLGLIFLFKFLNIYYDTRICRVTVLSILLGTHVFYYIADSGGMSHIYSFFLVSVLLFLASKWIGENSGLTFVLLCLSVALISLIRPSNLLLVFGILIFLLAKSGKGLEVIKKGLTPTNALIGVFIFGLVWLPQFCYWHYLTGNWWHYSYGNESFSNLAHPKILHFLFAPENGLIIYTPWIVFALIGCYFSICKKWFNAIIALTFIAAIYLYSAWHQYYFGCGFGSRNFVEYLPLLAFPAAGFLDYLRSSNNLVRFVSYFFLVLVCWANLSLGRNYSKCFGGNFHWDWDQYKYYLLGNTTRINLDFEESSQELRDESKAHSGRYSVLISDSSRFAVVHDFVIGSQSLGGYRQAELSAWFLADSAINIIDVLLRVDNEVEPLGTTQITFPGNKIRAGQWVQLSAKVNVCRPTPLRGRMKLIFTGASAPYRVDDVQLILR